MSSETLPAGWTRPATSAAPAMTPPPAQAAPIVMQPAAPQQPQAPVGFIMPQGGVAPAPMTQQEASQRQQIREQVQAFTPPANPQTPTPVYAQPAPAAPAGFTPPPAQQPLTAAVAAPQATPEKTTGEVAPKKTVKAELVRAAGMLADSQLILSRVLEALAAK